jgi:hypothetical protein
MTPVINALAQIVPIGVPVDEVDGVIRERMEGRHMLSNHGLFKIGSIHVRLPEHYQI